MERQHRRRHGVDEREQPERVLVRGNPPALEFAPRRVTVTRPPLPVSGSAVGSRCTRHVYLYDCLGRCQWVVLVTAKRRGATVPRKDCCPVVTLAGGGETGRCAGSGSASSVWVNGRSPQLPGCVLTLCGGVCVYWCYRVSVGVTGANAMTNTLALVAQPSNVSQCTATQMYLAGYSAGSFTQVRPLSPTHGDCV